jgi:uncharacterized protein (TIGR02231 family)
MKISLHRTISCLIPFMIVPQLVATTLTSSIQEVIAYPDGARIIRDAHAAIIPGTQWLELGFLPDALDDASLSAAITDPEIAAIIRDIQILSEGSDPETHPSVQEKRSAVSELRDSRDAQLLEVSRVQRHIQFAEQIMASYADGYGKATTLPNPDTTLQVWAYYESTLRNGQQELNPLKAKLTETEDQLKTAEKELTNLLNELRQKRKRARFLVESGAPAELAFTIEYQVRRCGWSPVYEVHVSPEGQKVQLRYLASLMQQTGEDWNEVKLTLSTGRSQTWSHLPELYPIRLNQVVVRPMPAGKGLMRSAMDGDMAMESMVMSAPFAPEAPVFSESFSAYEVRLPQVFSLKSSGERNQATLIAQDIEARIRTEVVPSRQTEGILVAEVSNALPWPLVHGEAILWVEGRMAGRTHLAATPVGETIKLSLGSDPKIKVERTAGKNLQADRGVIGRTTRITRQYFTAVTNLRSKEHRILVKDQFPLSENERIEIKRHAPGVKDATIDDLTGIFTWDLTLQPAQERTLETRFEVIYPQDWTIPLNF